MTRIIRLHTNTQLSQGATIALTKPQAHYLRNVLRREIGAPIDFFNGRDGQWSGVLETLSKTNGSVVLSHQTKEQETPIDLWVICAPIKKDRFDFCIEKTVELGASDFLPVFTDFTDIKRANIDRLTANAIEAAQQCEATALTAVHTPQTLHQLIDGWDNNRPLFVCAERQSAKGFSAILEKEMPTKAAILIGPEGGFSESENALLSAHEAVQFIHLGSRILRTETALAAAISIYQSVCGSWPDHQR